MTRRLAPFLLAGATTLAAWGDRALAQGLPVPPGGEGGLPTRAPPGTTTGLKLDDDVMMHAGAGVEAGWDSNVFYGAAGNTMSSPIVRVVPFIEFTNKGRGGIAPTGVSWDTGASLLARQYVSGDPLVKNSATSLSPTVGGEVDVNSGQHFSFGLRESFTRNNEPPYRPGQTDLVRDANLASAQVMVGPGGGRLQGTLRLTNSIEFFETKGLESGNNMGNELLLDTAWRVFPKTSLYVRLSQGFVTYFNAGQHDSKPLHALLGLRGLVTAKVTTNLYAGYGNGFYDGPASTSGLGSLVGGFDLNYRASPRSGLALGFQHDYRNSPLVGSFYYVDAPYLSIQQLIAGRLALQLGARYELRRYQGADMAGVIDRTDNLITGGVSLDYGLNRGFYVGVGYTLAFNASNAFIPVPGGDDEPLSYAKSQVFARAGIAF